MSVVAGTNFIMYSKNYRCLFDKCTRSFDMYKGYTNILTK